MACVSKFTLLYRFPPSKFFLGVCNQNLDSGEGPGRRLYLRAMNRFLYHVETGLSLVPWLALDSWVGCNSVGVIIVQLDCGLYNLGLLTLVILSYGVFFPTVHLLSM